MQRDVAHSHKIKNFKDELGKARQFFKDGIDLVGHTSLKKLAVNEA